MNLLKGLLEDLIVNARKKELLSCTENVVHSILNLLKRSGSKKEKPNVNASVMN